MLEGVEKMLEAAEHVAGDREDFWKTCMTDQVMSRYITSGYDCCRVLSQIQPSGKDHRASRHCGDTGL